MKDEIVHPLASGAPPEWAEGWGEDQLGPFLEIFLNERLTLRFRWVPGGTFWMGAGEDDEEAYDLEKPQHEVTLSEGLWLGETPVTQKQWQAVTGANPSKFQRDDGPSNQPVELVSWNDCQEFIACIESGRGERGPIGLRLPTEAEWERACRAGTITPRYGEIDEVAWHASNTGHSTEQVRRKKPNPLGLFDMLGNVWEWCADDWQEYAPESVVDPLGELGGDGACARGGSWVDVAGLMRAAYRFRARRGNRHRYLGFRLARGRALQPQGSAAAEPRASAAVRTETGRDGAGAEDGAR